MKVLFYFNAAYAWPYASYNRNFTRQRIEAHPELEEFLIINPKTGKLADRYGAYQRTRPDGWEFTREFAHASIWVNTET